MQHLQTLGAPATFEVDIVILIPAYRPSDKLLDVLMGLRGVADDPIVVVDDGSGPDFQKTFEVAAVIPNVRLLRHAVNLGKGAALKTGINDILCRQPGCTGVVTADADGQHAPEDIFGVVAALRETPKSLVLGVRQFSSESPWRSRFGNGVTKALFRLLTGRALSDTQTGLRGIPKTLLARMLEIPTNRYEFELDTLLLVNQLQLGIREVPIRTLYFNTNQGSHFNPLLDSMRIYFVLLRFGFVSVLTAFVDNVVFILALKWGAGVASSQALARFIAMSFNYVAVRKAVFLSHRDHRRAFPRYLALVAASGFASYAILTGLNERFGLNLVYAKLVAETLLFLANFVIQRDMVFIKDESVDQPAVTDWDRYYRSVAPTARLTRRYTISRLIAVLERCRRTTNVAPDTITEIGGANSCLLAPIVKHLGPSRYRVIDTNAFGLDLLRKRPGLESVLELEQASVLNLPATHSSDIVFSVGLIEHFPPLETAQAIQGHLRSVKPGGILLLTFPTPTWLYRISRRACEVVGAWRFPDERPLIRDEVLAAVGASAELWHEEVLWPLIFTQRMMVFRSVGERAAPEQG